MQIEDELPFEVWLFFVEEQGEERAGKGVVVGSDITGSKKIIKSVRLKSWGAGNDTTYNYQASKLTAAAAAAAG